MKINSKEENQSSNNDIEIKRRVSGYMKRPSQREIYNKSSSENDDEIDDIGDEREPVISTPKNSKEKNSKKFMNNLNQKKSQSMQHTMNLSLS